MALATALVALLAVFAMGNHDADAHPAAHPQKKLFAGRWYKANVDLTTSPPWFGVPGNPANGIPDYPCDGGIDTHSCVSKWSDPAYWAIGDWNNQPSGAKFFVQPYRSHNWDTNIYIIDNIPGAPGLLGYAAFYDNNGYECVPHPYVGAPYCPSYRWGDAVIVDDNHTGVFGPPLNKMATVNHELGHVLSLRHESVNADESVRYECGQDSTGPTPPSVMSYDCISPPGSPYFGAGQYYVQDWDTCGVNHAYFDPFYEWEDCWCYTPPGGGPAPPGPVGYYHPVTPARILDTRNGTGGITGRLGPGCHGEVQVIGMGGVPISGVSAVVLNVTVAQATRGSFLTVYPTEAGLPNSSNLNFEAGQTVANLVTVKVGSNGKVRPYNAAGQTHVIFDVVGWYGDTPDNPPEPTPIPDPGGYGFYHPLPPARIMDTRVGVPPQNKIGKVGPGETTDALVTGVGGVPSHASGVTAVALNVTVTEPSSASYLTVYPTGVLRPNASNLNFLPGQSVPNLVVVKVGYFGKVDLFNCCGFTHVIFDVVGWYGDADTDGTLFRSLSPARITDTRFGLGWGGKLGHGGTANITVTGVGGVPVGAKAVVLNATVTEVTGAGYLTVYPSDVAPRPNASNLNFVPGQTVPNLVIVRVAPIGHPHAGKVNVYNAAGQTHVVFDVVGYFE